MTRLSKRTKKTAITLGILASCVAGTGTACRAADDIETKNDARLEVFPTDKNAVLKDAGTATTWLAFAALGMIGLGGLFLNAKRTHLD